MLLHLVRTLFDLLVPPRRTDALVRELTLERLHALAEGGCLPYHDPRVTALIWELKYYRNARAAALLGAFLAEELMAAASESLGEPLLIPVPMHRRRRRERGHNHTEKLCEAALQRITGITYAPYALERIADTPTQQGLPRNARLRNVAHSMRASTAVAGRACIVVDDVATTGATLREAKRALLEAGGRVVHTIALARS